MKPAASEPRILVTSSGESRPRLGEPQQAWRWISWFSLILALAGLGDWLLAWFPMRVGSPEWEFGTVVSSFAGLPLITIGFAGLLGSGIARGVRWQTITVAVAGLVFACWILAASLMFLLDVPVALNSVQGVARVGITKAIAKTGFLGALFLTGYLVAGIGALRHASRLRAR